MWQKWLDAMGDAAPAFLSVAVDVQGPDLPARYVKRHGVTYPVVVDRANVIAGSFLGERVIPLWTVLDEEGRLVATGRGGAKRAAAVVAKHLGTSSELSGRAATRPPTLEELEGIASRSPHDVAAKLALASRMARDRELRESALEVLDPAGLDGPGAKAIQMARADVLLRMKRKDAALVALRAALALDPGDYLVRKQIWCIEAPAKFYEGKVDYRWQGERLREDRAAGSDRSDGK